MSHCNIFKVSDAQAISQAEQQVKLPAHGEVARCATPQASEQTTVEAGLLFRGASLFFLLSSPTKSPMAVVVTLRNVQQW
jgi:hypothetical protein